jgi:hypothetical protein
MIGMSDTDVDVFLVKPRLKLLDAFEIFRILFRAAGIEMGYSDKGNYTRECIDRFGSLNALARELLEETRRRLFDKFKDNETPNKEGVFDQGVLIKDRRYLDLAAIRKVIFVPEVAVTKGSLNAEIDLLCIADGMVVLGEAKVADKLDSTANKERKEAGKHRRLAESIRADRFVYATLADSWRAATIDIVREEFAGSRVQLEFMSKHDLLTEGPRTSPP